MKTQVKSLKHVILVFVILFGALNVNAQRGRNISSCCQNIPNLTEEQEAQIRSLEAEHQEKMAEFRQERRATTNYDKKSDIRQEMLKEREDHRKEVRSLLTADQKTYFDKNYQNNRRYNSRGNDNCNNRRGKNNRRNNGKGKNW